MSDSEAISCPNNRPLSHSASPGQLLVREGGVPLLQAKGVACETRGESLTPSCIHGYEFIFPPPSASQRPGANPQAGTARPSSKLPSTVPQVYMNTARFCQSLLSSPPPSQPAQGSEEAPAPSQPPPERRAVRQPCRPRQELICADQR